MNDDVVQKQRYAVRDSGDTLPPKYRHVMQSLTDRELVSELREGRGDPSYQQALRVEASRRGVTWK